MGLATTMRPKISVVTPSFNQVAFLESTINSVLDQNYPNLEYIITDGGSNDGSVEIIRKYSDKLHYWVSERDSGHGHALNKGFARSTGEIMCWLNSDDMHLPWALNVVSEIFTVHPQINWIVGFNACWNDQGVLTTAHRRPKNIYDFLLGNYAWVQQESVFWRRSLWDRAGARINENFRLMVDGELWSQFFASDALYAVDCILSGYRIHSNNRALTYMNDCHQEMRAIVDQMRRACASDVIATAGTLALVKRLKRAPIVGRLPIEPVARRLLPKTYAAASYPLVEYESGSWKLSRLAFSS